VDYWRDRVAWASRNTSFAQLNGKVSFGWLAGNHDYYSASNQYIGNQYYSFNPDNWAITGAYNNGRNTAQFISVGGHNFLFINLQYNASQDTLSWFDNLYYTYINSIVIVSTHSYIDPNGHYTYDGLSPDFLDNHPNVKLVVCGHLNFAYNQYVKNREEVLFDRQQRAELNFTDNSDYMRIYSVYSGGTVEVMTYSKYRNNFLTDSFNHFNFPLFNNSSPTPTATPSPTTTPTPTPTPTPSPSPTPTPKPTATPTPTPTPLPTISPTPSPTPALTPMSAPIPTPTPIPTPLLLPAVTPAPLPESMYNPNIQQK
jgi:cell division septation protein DedD